MSNKTLINDIVEECSDCLPEEQRLSSKILKMVREEKAVQALNHNKVYSQLRRDRMRAGVIPYGWRLVDKERKELEPHLTEQKNLHVMIYSRNSLGLSYAKIADKLNGYGKKSRTGKKFTAQGIHSLIKHKKAGQLVRKHTAELGAMYCSEYYGDKIQAIRKEESKTVQTLMDRYGEDGVG